MKPSLVILSTNFGSNFSGGCSVTHEILRRLQDQFSQIIFVGSRLGTHQINNLIFIQSRTWLKTYFVLRRLRKFHHIFYGDFYNAFLLALAQTKYVFTYHDNWPELAELSFRHKTQNFFYSKIYEYIFNHAFSLITVSEYKKNIIGKWTDTPAKVIPNGFSKTEIPADSGKKEGILMVGNIDQRKYNLALNLFKTLEHTEDLRIDIYGHFGDEKLVSKLREFPFVNLKGFSESIPYHSYKFLLHTSFIESFGMVFLEAIALGLPVLTFKRGGAKEIIGSKNGILIEPYRIDKMKHALNELLKNPFQADSNTVSQYTWEKASQRYAEIFRHAC